MEIDWIEAPEKANGLLMTKPDNVHHPKQMFTSEFYVQGCNLRGKDCDGNVFCAPSDCWEWYARPAEQCAADGLPPLESTVRIVPGDATIWDVAEQFVGVDCRLKAVFMLDETQMVAVESIESGQYCCFWASMVRTPERAKAEEREAGIENLLDWVAAQTKVDRAEVYKKNWAVLYDAGLRSPVTP